LKQAYKIKAQSFWFSLLSGGIPIYAAPFDEKPYALSGSFNTPMDTIAGLTDWGQGINYVYGITTAIVAFVFLAVSIPLIYAIRRFRVKESDLAHLKPPKQVHGNALLEFIWTIVPVILLLFIAIPTWQIIFRQPDANHLPAGTMKIEVVGHQWWWEFRYPELGITTANELHLPENTPVYFALSSADVIHSFWVPQFGGKLDAIPGTHINHLFLTTPHLQHPGKSGGEYYQGQCAELCGLSHALMRFEAVVHGKAEFERWALAYHKPPVVETAQQKRGEQVFMQCMSCHTIYGTQSEELEKQMLAMTPPTHKAGPNLTDFGSRRTLGAGTRSNTAENFHAWVHDPASIKPGSRMVGLGLSPEDIEAVGAYLRQSTAKTY
jgi:cytochrome c oxidase subunit 2